MDLDGVFDDDGDAQGMLKELEGSTVEDITMRTRLLENEIRVLRDESNRLALDLQSDKEKVKENVEKIKMNKQLPYLVGNVVEILDMNPEVGGGGDAARRAIPDPSAPPPPLSVRSDARPPPTPLSPRVQEEEEEDGGNVDLDSRRQGKAVVLKTTTRQTIFLPVIGLVDGGAKPSRSKPASQIRPGGVLRAAPGRGAAVLKRLLFFLFFPRAVAPSSR